MWDAQKDMFMAFCGAVLITLIVLILKKSLQRKQETQTN
jgi:uncharacterized membrane protein YjdF